MNKQRRKAIEDIKTLIDGVRAQIEDESYSGTVEEILDEEQEYYDNMPESLSYSEKGEIAQAAIENLSEARDYVDEALAALENAVSSLESAAE